MLSSFSICAVLYCFQTTNDDIDSENKSDFDEPTGSGMDEIETGHVESNGRFCSDPPVTVKLFATKIIGNRTFIPSSWPQ